jgi:hypothetical protein
MSGYTHIGLPTTAERKGLPPSPAQKQQYTVAKEETPINWKHVWMGITLLFIILAVVVVGISLFRSSSADNITRFCFKATADQVSGAPGEAGGGYLEGTFQLDTESNLIDLYAFFPTVNMSQIVSVVIMGPRAARERNGPEYFSICGAPNLVNVCDVLTIPGELKQTLRQLQPGAEDNRPAILAIRAQPSPYYYIEVRTAAFPNSPGALRAELSATCGFP